MPAATISDLRTYLGAGAGVTDAALTDALGSANDAVAAVLKSGTDMALPAVKGFVLAVAAQVWRNTSAGGTVSDYGDMAVAAGAASYPGLAHDPDLLADVACVALNRLQPRYIRHEVDFAFYLSERERQDGERQVQEAVEYAFGFVQARHAMRARR